MNNIIKQQVIGIDVGVEKTSLALVDLRGTILAQDAMNTKDYPSVSSFVEALSERIIQLAEQNGGYETIRSVGISVPSGNYVTGCIENAANMPWKGVVPLAAMLRDSVGLAVALGNDAHVTALGEYVYGSAHGMENFIVISLGHGGIGSCFFSNGMPYLGSGGFAGEIGHTCVEENGRLCTCGRRGCLEYDERNWTAEDTRGEVHAWEDCLAAAVKLSEKRSANRISPSFITPCPGRRTRRTTSGITFIPKAGRSGFITRKEKADAGRFRKRTSRGPVKRNWMRSRKGRCLPA